jgi:hypothetical protein
MNKIIYIPELENLSTKEELLIIEPIEEELVLKYLKLFDTFYREIKLYEINEPNPNGPKLFNVIMHFRPIKGNIIETPINPKRGWSVDEDEFIPLERIGLSEKQIESKRINAELERFLPKIYNGHLLNGNDIENYIVKNAFYNKEFDIDSERRIYRKSIPDSIENGSILLVISNNEKKFYSFEEFNNLHAHCDYFAKFTDITKHVIDDFETNKRWYQRDYSTFAKSGPFLKYTFDDINYHNNIKIYNSLTEINLLNEIKNNWYTYHADEDIIKADLRNKDEEFLNSLSKEEYDVEIKRREIIKIENYEKKEEYYDRLEEEYGDRNESKNSSFYDATDGQLGELGEEGWMTIGRD